MGGEAERGAVMGCYATGSTRSGLDLVQGTRQQPAFGQQGIDGGDAKGNRGRFAASTGAVCPLQTPDLFPQGSGDQSRRIVGSPSVRGSKGTRGNDRHRPLVGLMDGLWVKCSCFVLVPSQS